MGKRAHVPYRGWKSTKLHLALIAMAAIFAGYAATGFDPQCFGAFVMGMLGGAAVYGGGNVAEKLGAPPPEPPGPL